MPTDTKSQARRLLPWVISQALAVGTFSAQAATITVDDTSGTIGGGGCTIRDAFTAANTDAAAAGCAAGSGADSIVLPSSATITLDTLDNSGINCLPLVDSNITIVGSGTTVRRSPTGDSCRLIEVTPTGSLTLQDTTLSGGFAYQQPQQAAKGTTPNRDGGAIFSVGGNVTITGSTISGNSAVSGGGVAIKYATLLIQDSTVTGNTATLLGGGVYASGDGVVCSVGSYLTSNSAGAGGGAFVYNGFSPAKRKGAIIERAKSWQKAAEKGDPFECKYEPASASFIDSTVSGNTASGLTFTKGSFRLFCRWGRRLFTVVSPTFTAAALRTTKRILLAAVSALSMGLPWSCSRRSAAIPAELVAVSAPCMATPWLTLRPCPTTWLGSVAAPRHFMVFKGCSRAPFPETGLGVLSESSSRHGWAGLSVLPAEYMVVMAYFCWRTVRCPAIRPRPRRARLPGANTTALFLPRRSR